MNKKIIASASDNELRYLSLYEESININLRLESKDRLRSIEIVYYNFFEDQELIMWGILLK